MTKDQYATPLPEFTPALPGFRAEEFLTLTETLLAVPIEQDQAQLNAAPFRISAPEPLPEGPLPPLPPRWYPRPAASVIEAARVSLTLPPRPPVFEGRASELERVMRPLLSGHPVAVRGEPGIGKTTLLAIVANHERTRQRFRRIWWIDQPSRLDQTLALVLNLPHALVEPDPVARRALLVSQLDEHTLLIVDNVALGDVGLSALHTLSPHVLVAIETEPEILDPDEPIPEDADGVVTLRALDDTAAIDALALHAGFEETRKIRSDLYQITKALGNHPFALALAGRLISLDQLPLSEVQALLRVTVPDSEIEIDRTASLIRALDVSMAALPGDYRTLFETFGAFPPDGAPFDGLRAAARIGSPLACRRGLLTLAQYGFIHADHRDPDRYIMHPVAYTRAAAPDPAKNPLVKRMRTWALQTAKEHAADPLTLYRLETSLVYAVSARSDKPDALLNVLRPYLREYTPGYEPDADLPDISGPRAEGTSLTRYGLELTDQGAYFAAEEALNRALELRQEHDSPYAVAETQVALARLYDRIGHYSQAAELLIGAAESVYRLGVDESLSVVRRGLARVYRHMGRLDDALEVLDAAPESHQERAAILRARGDYPAAVEEIIQAEDASPYSRAELFLLAERYDEALAATADQTDLASAHLRAQIYHQQGRMDEAIEGYRAALDCCVPDDAAARAKTLRGLGAVLAADGQIEAARETLEEALKLQQSAPTPDPLAQGRTLRLLAAVHFITGDDPRAIETARAAIGRLEPGREPGDYADAFRTLGRALWRQADYAGALEAFQNEVDAAQSMVVRNETRIGLALHHLADASRMTGNLDRAVANYRRALTHKNPASDPSGYLMTQLALHRALVEQGRLPGAVDVAEEIVDHLEKTIRTDLVLYGYAQAIRARTQQAAQRPIRATQLFAEWLKRLAVQANDAVRDPHPAIRVLVLGLAVRSLLAEGQPALVLAENSLAAAEEYFPGTPAAWAARRDLGETYLALDRPTETIQTLEPLCHDETVRTQPATAALAHRLTGDAYRQLKDHPATLEHLRAALIDEPEPYLRGLIQETIGDVQLEMGLPTDGVESFRAALPLLDRTEHPDAAARALTTLAHTLGGLNRYAEAVDVYEEALVVLRDVEGVSPTHTADVLRSLGQTHEAQGQLPEAAHAYRRALTALEHVEAPRQQRDLLHLLARVAAAQGDPDTVSLYEQARDLTRDWGDHQQLGEVLCELGTVHRDAGRTSLAVQNYQEALEYQTGPLFVRDRVNTLRNLGRAYAQMEHYDEARTAWSEALDLSTDLPDQSPLEIALTYHAIAEAHRSQGHYTDAELAYREALQHHTPGTIAAAATWRALGQMLLAANRPNDALEPLQHALEAEKAQPQQANVRLIGTLQALAEAHEARGDLKSAITRHHEVLVYMDRRLQAVAYAETLRTLGRLYAQDKNYAEAHVAYDEALEIENNYVPRSDDRISATLQAIADTYRAEGLLEKAAEYYQKVTAYANFNRRASRDLRETLDELERRRGTLQAAQQSLTLLDRADRADIKDLAYIYALIANAHAGLAQPQESADTIHTLLDTLEQRRDELHADDERPDYRALAWLVAACQEQDQGDLRAAQAACQAALEAVRNANLRWVIEQVAHSLEA